MVLLTQRFQNLQICNQNRASLWHNPTHTIISHPKIIEGASINISPSLYKFKQSHPATPMTINISIHEDLSVLFSFLLVSLACTSHYFALCSAPIVGRCCPPKEPNIQNSARIEVLFNFGFCARHQCAYFPKISVNAPSPKLYLGTIPKSSTVNLN